MAWERRRNGRRYFYRGWRDPMTQQVRKQYCGGGACGEAAAQADADRRAERAAQRQAEQERRLAYDAVAEQVVGLGKECDDLARSALAEAGVYQHLRGEWRRYGGKTTKNS